MFSQLGKGGNAVYIEQWTPHRNVQRLADRSIHRQVETADKKEETEKQTDRLAESQTKQIGWQLGQTNQANGQADRFKKKIKPTP